MSESLEAHEHAEHAAESGRRGSALMIAVVAAGLAFAEQAAQHAQTDLSAHAIAATDLWSEYQAKSIRANQAHGLADLAAVLAPAGPDRDALVAKLRAEASGKPAIAAHAKAEEAARDHAHERLEAFENAAALLQLAIVLITASVIANSTLLLAGGCLVGALGAAAGLLGLVRPGLTLW
jgi:hypothetical protein